MALPQSSLCIAIAGNPSAAAGSTVIVQGPNSAPVGYGTAGLGGPTSARPQVGAPGVATLQVGTHYLDTTLSVCAVWDGASWRNPFTGAVV